MRFRNAPLLVDALESDVQLYVPRPGPEKQLRAAILQRRNTLLTGRPGTGKTSVLHQAVAAAQEQRPALGLAWVNAAWASSAVDLLGVVSLELTQPGEATRSASGDNGWLQTVHAIRALPGDREAVVILDGLEDASIGYTLFGRLRDEVWTLPYTWIVAARPEIAVSLRAAPADAFWEQRVTLEDMDSEQIDDLLKRALDPDELERLRRDGGSCPLRDTPRRVIQRAQRVLSGEASTRADADLLLRGAAQVGAPAGRLMAALLHLDRPVTAGDPDLLAATGWDRTYASRWLRALERAGLLRSWSGPPGDVGRPPKLYEPRTETAPT